MSRKKAPFKNYEGKKEKDRHVRLTDSMLNSKIFKSLNFSSIILYIYMKLWACGREEFDYALSLGCNVMSKRTVITAINELENKGFIDKIAFSTGGGHKANTYKFSANWICKSTL